MRWGREESAERGSEARPERASVAGELERGGGGFREWPVSKC